MLLENVKYVVLWWIYLPPKVQMAPRVTYLMIQVICFSLTSPILLGLYYWDPCSFKKADRPTNSNENQQNNNPEIEGNKLYNFILFCFNRISFY